MRAVFAPLTNRIAPHSVHRVGSLCFASALLILIVTPGSSSNAPIPGDIVDYSEDQLGRPWKIVRKYEFHRFVIRNGRVTVIADAHELTPFEGYAGADLSIQKAGQPWKEFIAEFESKRH